MTQMAAPPVPAINAGEVSTEQHVIIRRPASEKAARFAVALINAVLGTITAWVLVRESFRGKSFVNAIIAFVVRLFATSLRKNSTSSFASTMKPVPVGTVATMLPFGAKLSVLLSWMRLS